MEERIVDKDDERLIRIKRTADGVDAEDATVAEEAQDNVAEEEVVFEIPDEEFDEDLVGLTPSQLEQELQRRKKAEAEARAEYEKLVSAADALMKEEKYAEAEKQYAEAARFVFADEHTVTGLWTARTKNFTDFEPLYNKTYMEELAEADENSIAFVRKRAEHLKEERATFAEEEEALAPSVLEKQTERRQAFEDNRKYYSLRTLALFGVMALMIVGCIVSASFIVKTLSIAPVVCTAVFGGLALFALIGMLLFLRKLLVAKRLCNANEELSSTQDGKKLEDLRNKIACLDLLFGDGLSEGKKEEQLPQGEE